MWLLLLTAASAAPTPHAPPPPTRYVVRFHVKSTGVDAKKLLIEASPTGSVNVTRSFSRVLNGGFAAELSPHGVAFLASQPGISVEPVGQMHALLPVMRADRLPAAPAKAKADAVSPFISGETP